MMRLNKYTVTVILFLLLFLSGCGVKDKALILTPGNAGEELSAGEEARVAPEVSGVTEDAGAAGTEEGAAAAFIYVHVCGAVNAPGVVELKQGSRAEDALQAAGGFAEDAHREYVNLASRLEDGQQLFFPTEEEAHVLMEEEKQARLAAYSQNSSLVNINTAGEDLLCTLPGIGETRAQAIIGYRQANGAFQKVEDIMKVPGIKQSAYEKISSRITVE